MNLSELDRDSLAHPAQARIIAIKEHTQFPLLKKRLLELGFIEGSLVEIVQSAPWGGDPLIVRIRGGLIALRRAEAAVIEVQGDGIGDGQ